MATKKAKKPASRKKPRKRRSDAKTRTSSAARPRTGKATSKASKSSQVRSLLAKGMSASDIAKKVGCTPALVYQIKSKSGLGSRRRSSRHRGASTGLEGIAAMLESVQGKARELQHLRATLEQIQRLANKALA